MCFRGCGWRWRGTVAYFGFSVPSFMGLMACLVFLMAVRAAMVRYQWWFLRRFNLTCPYRERPLGRATGYLNNPSHNCPHCGRQALASIRQLMEFEKANG